VLVRTGETVDILLDVTNPGRWMAHCHIAEHHESGMMFSFDVAPSDGSPEGSTRAKEVANAEIALFLYDDVTALDAVGPYEVLARLPEAEVKFVASTPGPKKTDVGLVLTADSALEEVPAPDIIVIP
jgi:Multicopper oxidase